MKWARLFGRLAAGFRGMLPSPPGVRAKSVTIETSPGELIDKITILEIKAQRIGNADQLRNVRIELDLLRGAQKRAVRPSDELASLRAELRSINEALWDIEDEIRACERNRNFGPRFIELARSVYQTNDRRAAVKRRINELLGSRIVEEKSYFGNP